MKIFIRSFAKVLGFLFSILFFLVFLNFFSNFITDKNKNLFQFTDGNQESDEIIAVLNLKGPIISEPFKISNYKIFNSIDSIYPSLIEKYIKELEKLDVKGLLISINSPGGSVSATEEIYVLLNQYKEKNKIPIYFHTSDILASGAYWLAQSGNKIFANYGAIIGSIGVKGPDWIYYNAPTSLSPGLLQGGIESPNGIELFSSNAGISKDIFNPFRKPTKIEIDKLQFMINDIYEDFVNKVSKNRKIERVVLKNDIGAMIFSSKQAKLNYLIDDELNKKNVIKLMSNNLQFKSIKIISNIGKPSFNFFGVSISYNLFHKHKVEYYNKAIQNIFCDNLINQISAVGIVGNYKNNC